MRGRVHGHFGELLQGRLGPQGPVALVTLPCPVLAAEACFRPARGLHIWDGGLGVLTRTRAASLLESLTLPRQGRFTLRMNLPPGGGAGASSAALMALARAAGATNPTVVTAAALAVEGATDPLLFAAPERILWASRRGQVVGHLAKLPRFQVLGGFLGPGQRTDPQDNGFPDITDLVAAWSAACRDLTALAALISESARRTLAQRGPAGDPTAALATDHHALGYLIAHTGSARGLIYPPGTVPQAAVAGLRAAGFSRITRFQAGG
jgi:uncharacterized protein involved in propanediol utilization